MFRRGNVYWARKDVPKKLQAILGTTSLQDTLNTTDETRARVLIHDMMKSYEARIANARAVLAGQPPQFEFEVQVSP